MERVDESVGCLMPRIKSVKTSVRAEKDADWERERCWNVIYARSYNLMSARKSFWQLCLSKSIGSRNKIDTTLEFPKFVSLIDCPLRPNHLDHQPVADVEELVLAWPQSGHKRSASLRVLAPVEAVELGRHPVEVVIRVPGERKWWEYILNSNSHVIF